MSLESARKLGLTASLIYVLMPIISVVGAVVLVLSIIATAVTRTGPGTVTPNILSGGLPRILNRNSRRRRCRFGHVYVSDVPLVPLLQ